MTIPESNPYTPPAVPVELAKPEPLAPDPSLTGLGGWLILLGFAVALSPFKMSTFVFNFYSMMFVDGGWAALTTPGGPLFHPLWAPLLGMELTFNTLSLLAQCYIVYLFFARKRRFVPWFVWLHCITLVFLVVDPLTVKLVRPETESFDWETRKDIGRALFACIVWIPYLHVSRRVELTFTR